MIKGSVFESIFDCQFQPVSHPKQTPMATPSLPNLHTSCSNIGTSSICYNTTPDFQLACLSLNKNLACLRVYLCNANFKTSKCSLHTLNQSLPLPVTTSGLAIVQSDLQVNREQCGVVEVTPLSQCFFMEEHS